MIEGEVHVWLARAEDFQGFILGDDERVKAGKYRFMEDSRKFMLGRSLLRYALSSYLNKAPQDIGFKYERGKPFIPGSDIYFSLSRSGELAAVAVSLAYTGLDIEVVRHGFDMDGISERFFSLQEMNALGRHEGDARRGEFFRLWTRKEALLKATGEGIGELSPDVDVLNDVIIRKGKSWHLNDVAIAPGYAAAIALDSPLKAVRFYHIPR